MEYKRFNNFIKNIIILKYIMKIYILTLFFLGIIISIIGYYESYTSCPKQKIIYKFIDKSIEEAQKDQQGSVYNKFINMFVDSPILI